MDKGIIIGVEHEVATRTTLPFAMFRTITSVIILIGYITHFLTIRLLQTHLFIHHVLRYHLGRSQLKEAVKFASSYQNLVFFAHALEVLLHTILEAETDSNEKILRETAEHTGILPLAIEFLDHFDTALDVVVGCARKTEMSRWRTLFDIVGNPKALFEVIFSFHVSLTNVPKA